ncbi:alpha/beta hydrolase [Conexibacter stalactiti]|uniref:Alpha/beta hydrolase n=1 Tax=Conexibacter stalactiti TaxID=1940611 RepID=A0ABU4HL22_9ACTN|nr:alpha/beta hydrolase [Conexibacter stalactiti]MDW5593993.1 alpha/beta hydrolase [Conexibacter stalactiti]MEC5034635.1 alpha/beta hydrolase [Conexibacter stalactiti]
MSEITLPQGTVRYRERGPADGPAVLFVHGFLGNGTLWDGVAERLAQRGMRTFQPDLPLGAHPIALDPAADLSPRGVARLIAAFAAALELEDVTLVGNDSGGAVCQFLLDTDPSRIGRLVLTNCDAFEAFPPKPFNLILQAARRPWLFRAAMEPTRATAVRHSPLAFGLLAHRLDPAQTRDWVLPYLTDAGVRRDAAKFCRGVDPRELTAVASRLRRFDGPVLLCWGKDDRFFKPALAHRLQACFADARVVEVDDARTFVPIDQPARVADEITAFTARVPA